MEPDTNRPQRGRPKSAKPKAEKFSVSLRPDVYDKLSQLVDLTGLDRSGVISLLIQKSDLKEYIMPSRDVSPEVKSRS